MVGFQSIPEVMINCFMNFQYHGIKLLISNPTVANRAYCVAYALMGIFMLIGPLVILQPDNGREFSGMARHSSDRDSNLDDQYLDDVINNIKKLWPEVRMV